MRFILYLDGFHSSDWFKSVTTHAARTVLRVLVVNWRHGWQRWWHKRTRRGSAQGRREAVGQLELERRRGKLEAEGFSTTHF